jgi:hypothetical protein
VICRVLENVLDKSLETQRYCTVGEFVRKNKAGDFSQVNYVGLFGMLCLIVMM